MTPCVHAILSGTISAVIRNKSRGILSAIIQRVTTKHHTESSLRYFMFLWNVFPDIMKLKNNWKVDVKWKNLKITKDIHVCIKKTN